MPVRLTEEAEYMLSILQQMADLKTNPVLLSLENKGAFENKKKYHLQPIVGQKLQLRFFYHQHEYPDRPAEEHGHFHIFVQTDNNKQWQHWLLIVIDSQGQPTHLSTVNQWVTDSPWVHSNTLDTVYRALNSIDPEPLLNNWFIAILFLFRTEIYTLIALRDQHLSKIKEKLSSGDILNNRDIYSLSSRPIDLQQSITQHLKPE